MSDNREELKFYGSGKVFTNQDGTMGTVYLELDLEALLLLVKNPPEGVITSYTNKDGKVIKNIKLKANPTKADVSKLYIIQNKPRTQEGASAGVSTSSNASKDLPF